MKAISNNLRNFGSRKCDFGSSKIVIEYFNFQNSNLKFYNL